MRTPEQPQTTMSAMDARKKILVVDDSRSVANHIQNLLSSYYEATAVYSGEEALRILPEFMPDLILLDTVMPGMDGHEVCRKIRSDNAFRRTKIIMVSSRKKFEERIQGYEAGIDDHLGKPFQTEELLAKVNVFLRLKSVEDQLRELNDRLNEQVKLRTAQLIDAEKMAALGRHAAGIVHNLNNPLQAIMGVTHMLAEKMPDDRQVDLLNKAATHMKEIISTILTAGARENQEHMTLVDLNQVIEQQLSLLRANPHFMGKMTVEQFLSPLPLFEGIHTHFSQCLGNLLKNAAEAMYGSQTCRITVSSSCKNNTISITVKDTGPGISKEDMPRLFDPFFTTKPLISEGDAPTGTGIGLSYCKEIIESYGGRMQVTSSQDKGSSFTIRLPVEDAT